MAWILLTNDDGVDSPALVPFARALEAPGIDVRVVVPDRERSWIGKAISRTAVVRTAVVERGGLRVWTCSGYPADAAQLGIHALFDDGPPALVVSGINLGFNHGAGFVLSSGTVGAAIEGWVSGVPAIACSTGMVDGDFGAWHRGVRAPGSASGWQRLATLCADLVGDIAASGLAGHADVVNVNVPWAARADTPRRVTTVARTGYDRLFRSNGTPGEWRHVFAAVTAFDHLDGTDVEAAHDGAISITPLGVPTARAVPDGVRDRLERG